MILPNEINTVYFSELLLSDKRYTKSCDALTAILDKHDIMYAFLRDTKDIWCRDYMPIQVDKDRLIQFRYEPSYLKDDPALQSDPIAVCKANDINANYTPINLDGGNVVHWSDRVIISDKIYDENPEYTNNTKLIDALEALLEAEVIIIPKINTDMTGHADGMVRFIDRNTIIGNDRDQEHKYWVSKMNKILKEKGIDYIDLPFLLHRERKYPDHAIGCYVNYIEVKDVIVIPIFETKHNKDQEVYDLMCETYPDKVIETINYNEVGLYGGLLNCTTWTIKK